MPMEKKLQHLQKCLHMTFYSQWGVSFTSDMKKTKYICETCIRHRLCESALSTTEVLSLLTSLDSDSPAEQVDSIGVDP